MTEAIDDRGSDVWRVLYRVAEAAATAEDLPAFYRVVHAIVGELMDATNFFIALYDEDRGRICFPYYVDEVDDDIPDPDLWEPFGVGNARGATAYVLRTGEPQLLRPRTGIVSSRAVRWTWSGPRAATTNGSACRSRQGGGSSAS